MEVKKYGANSQYRALHMWVARQLGKPKLCRECGSTDPDKAYDWSNISGLYLKDTTDWIRLCHKCHIRKDRKKEACIHGHELKGDNLYVNPRGHRQCRKCKLKHMRDFNTRKKATR